MRAILLTHASPEELKEFCNIQNLEFHHKHGREALLGIIANSGWSKEHIELPDLKAIDVTYDTAPTNVDLSDPRQVSPDVKSYLMVELMIHSQDGKTSPVPVSDGKGKMMLIPRNAKATVRYPYYEGLCNAKGTIYDETENGLKEGRIVHSYPHQVFRIFEDADLKAAALKEAA